VNRHVEEKDRKPGVPLKDLDFQRTLSLPLKVRDQLITTIQRDSSFMCSQGLMDYSLLVGIHFVGDDTRTTVSGDYGVMSAEENEIFYIGIIDTLQQFNRKKKLEATLKRFKYDKTKISAVPPLEYKTRFLEYCNIKLIAV